MCCRAVAFAPCDAGLLLVAAHEDGQVRISSCSEPRLGHEASSWPCLYSLTTRTATLNPTDSSSKKCIDLSWQPRPHAQQPFLAVASSTAVSVWCYDQCDFLHHLRSWKFPSKPLAVHKLPPRTVTQVWCILGWKSVGIVRCAVHQCVFPAGWLWTGYVCVRT